MTTQPTSLTEIQIERLDDIPLWIGLQQQLGLDVIIDDVIPRHWRHQGLSLGQLVVGWNAYILSEADHRPVEEWGVEHQALSELFGVPVRRTDFSDDRLSYSRI